MTRRDAFMRRLDFALGIIAILALAFCLAVYVSQKS